MDQRNNYFSSLPVFLAFLCMGFGDIAFIVPLACVFFVLSISFKGHKESILN